MKILLGLILLLGLKAYGEDVSSAPPVQNEERQEIFLDQGLMKTFSEDDDGSFKIRQGNGDYPSYGIYLDPESQSTTREMETALDNPFRQIDRNRNDFSNQNMREHGFGNHNR